MMSLTMDSRRRSLSEGSRLARDEADDDCRQSLPALDQRSKSEGFICTAQGIVFQDTKCQQYQTKLKSLVALASSSSSSQSNVLLAKKALRYRKVLERNPVMV